MILSLNIKQNKNYLDFFIYKKITFSEYEVRELKCRYYEKTCLVR